MFLLSRGEGHWHGRSIGRGGEVVLKCGGGGIIGGKNFFGPNFVFLCLWRQDPFLDKTKGPTRNPISLTPPPSAGVHVTPPPRRAIFRLPLSLGHHGYHFPLLMCGG